VAPLLGKEATTKHPLASQHLYSKAVRVGSTSLTGAGVRARQSGGAAA